MENKTIISNGSTYNLTPAENNQTYFKASIGYHGIFPKSNLVLYKSVGVKPKNSTRVRRETTDSVEEVEGKYSLDIHINE